MDVSFLVKKLINVIYKYYHFGKKTEKVLLTEAEHCSSISNTVHTSFHSTSVRCMYTFIPQNNEFKFK